MFKKMKIAQVHLPGKHEMRENSLYDDRLDNSDDDEKYNEENVLLRTSPS